jgi:uncharacterized protein
MHQLTLFNKHTMQHNPQLLLDIVKTPMPFGKYKGTLICNLPVSYLEWFQREGFPQGKMGMMLQTIYEIKINGLEELLRPLKNK